jgi:predicted nucleic acid-binding protein
VDTSVIVAWLDKNHPGHRACVKALEDWAQRNLLFVLV